MFQVPTDAEVGTFINTADIQNVWGVTPDDGHDDTEALQSLASAHSFGAPGFYILLQLPAGLFASSLFPIISPTSLQVLLI